MTKKNKSKKIELRQLHGLSLAARGSSNHWVMMDQKENVGGHEAASSPMEMVLMALAGCTAMDVISILKKMRVNYEDFVITANGETADDYPKIFTNIKLSYQFRGTDLPENKLEKAVKLSKEKYCPVSAMLSKSVEIEYEIITDSPERD